LRTNLFISKTLRRSGSGGGRFGRGSAGITGASVAISVIIMFLAIAISDGFKKEIKSKAAGLSGEIILHSPGVDITTNLYPINTDYDYLKDIEKMQGVKALHPFAYRSGVLKNGNNIQGIMVKGVEKDFDWSFFESVMREGVASPLYADTTANPATNPGIIISERLASMLGYSVGDPVVVYFIDSSVKIRRFNLLGIYDAQLEDVDKTLVITDIEVVRQLNGWAANEVSGIEVKLEEGAEIGKTASDMEIIIEDSSEDIVFVTRVDEMFPHLFGWLDLIDFNVLFVLTLMIAVAGFNMISGLLILLFEKISMIGLLKALGMRNADIHKIFIMRAMRIVLKGMLIGNIVALILIFIQSEFKVVPLDVTNYFVDSVPVHINWAKIVVLNVASVIIIMFLLMIPSSFIAKVSPEKSLRIK